MSQAVTLDDKYVLETGRVYLTGTQALVRLPMMQRQRDLAAGLNTGGYITGYRGSPLGAFDQALWQAKKFIKKSHIEFQPGLNEDLAATALWGTQQIHLYPGAKYDGVMEMGLIHPPVGLNLFVIKNIAPDIPLGDVVWGVVPFVILMMLAVVVLCFAPDIALWLPDKIIK